MKTGNGKTGRPISFDKEAALEAGMLLFWERSFEGTAGLSIPAANGSTKAELKRTAQMASSHLGY
jgi:hypothetical protein